MTVLNRDDESVPFGSRRDFTSDGVTAEMYDAMLATQRTEIRDVRTENQRLVAENQRLRDELAQCGGASVVVRVFNHPDGLPRYAVFLNGSEMVGRYLNLAAAKEAAADLRLEMLR